MELRIASGIFLVAFFITVLTVPVLIKSCFHRKLMEFDINKKGRPQVCGYGGFSICCGTISGLLAGAYYLSGSASDPKISINVLGVLNVITILALIGIYDDIFKLGRKIKVFLPAFAALPLFLMIGNRTALTIPILGDIDFGIVYIMLLIPLGITGAANAINMSAGYNGLEAGIGAVASFFLFIIALGNNEVGAAIILASLGGACLGFLLFNWYPAKIFPGDIGTYLIGGTIGSAVIMGKMEIFGVICLIPAFYEFFATIYYSARKIERRSACHNPIIDQDGKLSPSNGSEYYTLAFFILSKKSMSERNLVLTMLSIYALFGFMAYFIYYKTL